MPQRHVLAVVSDIHYAGSTERARKNFQFEHIERPLQRFLIRLYRHHVWLRDPFAHNHLLDTFITKAGGADTLIANGDYSCDSAFIGVSDPAACDSARECLGKLRAAFSNRLHPILGDHELGKMGLGITLGGLRLASWHAAREQLRIQPLWSVEIGRYSLLGVASSLIALPVYQPETLPDERQDWCELRCEHLAAISDWFNSLAPNRRVLLFCHDPTALPFLWNEPTIRARLSQVEHTIIGHLHSRLLLHQSRILAGMPAIPFMGHTVLRLSQALRKARCWPQFRVQLCPSLAGIELLRDGGFCIIELDPDVKAPARFHLERIPW